MSCLLRSFSLSETGKLFLLFNSRRRAIRFFLSSNKFSKRGFIKFKTSKSGCEFNLIFASSIPFSSIFSIPIRFTIVSNFLTSDSNILPIPSSGIDDLVRQQDSTTGEEVKEEGISKEDTELIFLIPLSCLDEFPLLIPLLPI